MYVDSVIAFSNRLYVKVNNIVFIAITISLDCTVSLTERIVSPLVLVDLPYRPILTRYKDSSTLYVAGILEPILTRLSSTLPGAGNPTLLVLIDYTNTVIKAVRLVILATNTNDVQVVLT
jgi:hypothetical protein